MNLSDLQAHIQAVDVLPNKEHGYFLKLVEEVGELSEAIRKEKVGQPSVENIKGSIAEELVDVMYYVLALANLYDIDMEKTFEIKEQLNKIKYNR